MKRKTKEGPEGVLCLSPMDLALLLASQARADRADRDVQIAHLRRQLASAQQEVERLHLADKYRHLGEAVEQGIKGAMQDLAGAKVTHDELTRQLADKYAVDWATCAYNEQTGVITPAPKE